MGATLPEFFRFFPDWPRAAVILLPEASLTVKAVAEMALLWASSTVWAGWWVFLLGILGS